MTNGAVPREPGAFLSYVRSDDDHDRGRITQLRRCLEGEVKMQTGKTFDIFQDRNDLQWGVEWQQRIAKTLRDVTFLIPVVTPSYFQSQACRDEFDKFAIREKTLGEDTLILPIYYVTCDEMEDASISDEMATVLRTRNWADWRSLRFEPLDSPRVRAEIASLATMLKQRIKDLEGVLSAQDEQPRNVVLSTEPAAPPVTKSIAELFPSNYAIRGARLHHTQLEGRKVA